MNMSKKVLLVVSNPAISSLTGWPVGFWASELTHAYQVFENAGYALTVASPNGGKVEMDALSDPRHESGYSASDTISLEYLQKPEFVALLENTVSVASVRAADYDAIVVAGGQAPMFTFADAEGLQRLFEQFYAANKVSAALCHGVALLQYVKDSSGQPLVLGKQVTGFTNEEEDYVEQAVGQKVMPFRIEDELKALGGVFVKGAAFAPFAVQDGHLITGQQQNSGTVTAEMVVQALR
jgi:putative intracellular protease/amidase